MVMSLVPSRSFNGLKIFNTSRFLTISLFAFPPLLDPGDWAVTVIVYRLGLPVASAVIGLLTLERYGTRTASCRDGGDRVYAL